MTLTKNLANRSTCRLARIIANHQFCFRYSTYDLQTSMHNSCDVLTTSLVNQGSRSSFHNPNRNLHNNLSRRCLSSHRDGFHTHDGSMQTNLTSASSRPSEENIPQSFSINEAIQTSGEPAPNFLAPNNLRMELFFYGPSCSAEMRGVIDSSFLVFPDFITAGEEDALLQEVEPHLKRLRYEFDHWDDAIVGFRETEVGRWSSVCSGALQRLHSTAFSKSGSEVLVHTHILDLSEEGYIKPHVDSVRFCGTTISGLSLGSAAVMRLVREGAPDQTVDVILPRRSLYVMRDGARYHYTHEVLSNGASTNVPDFCRPHRVRRISIICRNQPT